MPPRTRGPASAAVCCWMSRPQDGTDGAVADDPFKSIEFIVLEFDPRNAGVSVLASDRGGMQYTGYSERNRDDAVEDARTAAANAQARGLPLRYAVVRIASEEVFPA